MSVHRAQSDPTPQLSVVISTDGLPAMEEMLAALRSQTAASVLELIVAAPKEAGLDPDDLTGFAAVQVIDIDATKSLPAGRAAGVRAASAPLVVFGETHSFPEPGWAQALIERHAGPWAGVGPAMLNATPDDERTWGSFYADYGPWIAPVDGGEVDGLPGHGSAYKRSVLLAYGDELDRMLDAEWNMHRDMRARGHRLYLDPAATTRHLNINQPLPAALQWMHYSRGLASARSAAWPAAKRGIYALAAPVIFCLRLARTLRDVRRTGRMHVLRASLPTMVASLAGSALGEAAGYITGTTGSSAERIVKYEVHRSRYVVHDN